MQLNLDVPQGTTYPLRFTIDPPGVLEGAEVRLVIRRRISDDVPLAVLTRTGGQITVNELDGECTATIPASATADLAIATGRGVQLLYAVRLIEGGRSWEQLWGYLTVRPNVAKETT